MNKEKFVSFMVDPFQCRLGSPSSVVVDRKNSVSHSRFINSIKIILYLVAKKNVRFYKYLTNESCHAARYLIIMVQHRGLSCPVFKKGPAVNNY